MSAEHPEWVLRKLGKLAEVHGPMRKVPAHPRAQCPGCKVVGQMNEFTDSAGFWCYSCGGSFGYAAVTLAPEVGA